MNSNALSFTVPARANGLRIKVVDTVKNNKAPKLMYRGPDTSEPVSWTSTCGDVKLADISLSPGNDQYCCNLNVFDNPTGTYSAKSLTRYNAVVRPDELKSVYEHPKWKVGKSWTLSVVVTSNDDQDRVFDVAGNGGSHSFTVPKHAKGLSITVTDTVKAEGARRLQYRGYYRCGDVNISSIEFSPRYSGACCGLNVFFHRSNPTGTYSGIGKRKFASVVTSAQLKSVHTHPKWKVGEIWTLSLLATSKVDEDRVFGMAGGGGFLVFTVPAGAEGQRITVTDTVKAVEAKLQYRGPSSGKCGNVELTEIVFIPGSIPDCLK